MAILASWCYDLREEFEKKHPTVIIQYYMEGGFIQTDLLDYFAEEGNVRGYQLPILTDPRKKPQKEARIESMIPPYQRGWVTYELSQKENQDMIDGKEQLLAWDIGYRGFDDSPDADESAWFLLNSRKPLQPGDIVTFKRKKSKKRL